MDNEELAATYEAWVAEHPFDNGGGGWAMEPWFKKEMPLTEELVQKAIDEYKDKVKGYKITGAGGGGYLVLINDKPIEEAIQIRIRRK